MLKGSTLLGLVLLLAETVLGGQLAGNTRGPTWLLTREPRVYCGSVPQVPTMQIATPDMFSPPCSTSAYNIALLRVWIWPLLAIVAVLVVAAVLGFENCRPNRRKAHTSGELYVSVHATFIERPRESRIVLLFAFGSVVLASMVVALVASDQLHALSENIEQIFRQNYQMVQITLESVAATITALGAAADAQPLLAVAQIESSVYRDNSEFYINSLQTSDGLRRAGVFVVTIGVFLVTVCGGLAIQLRMRDTMRFCLWLGFAVLVGLWANFAVYALAANVVSDVCVTVNECHFCPAPAAACPACQTPWFVAMNECDLGQAHRFKSLRDFVIAKRTAAGAAVCASLGALCAVPGLSCFNPYSPCSESTLLHQGLYTVVCNGDGGADCSSVSSAGSHYPLAANLSAAVELEYQTLQQWGAAHDALSSLDCNKDNAFLTSVPLGTYALLRSTLCPRDVDPANPPQTSIARAAASLLIAALLFPLALAVLWASLRRPTRTTTASLTK